MLLAVWYGDWFIGMTLLTGAAVPSQVLLSWLHSDNSMSSSKQQSGKVYGKNN